MDKLNIFMKLHRMGLKLGFQVVPNHYYSAVADINKLEMTKGKWAKKSEMPGVNATVDNQIKNTRDICLPFFDEYANNEYYNTGVSNHFGQGYGPIEAQALHAVIRHFTPSKIIEVGSGVSTYCIIKAIELNGCGELTCIEPYPSNPLVKLLKTHKIHLIEKEVQEIQYDQFQELNSGDLLFIDSSHTVKPGSDVNYMILEILPRLKPGVIVHFHDIFFPYDYPIDILNVPFQWNETSLLWAFLINNEKAEILFCLSHLHYERKDALAELFPKYDPLELENGLITTTVKERIKKHFPASIFIRIK